MLKNCPLKDDKGDAEVAKEYDRLQEEKCRTRPNHAKDMEAMRSHMTDLEGNVIRLGETMAASQKQMEELLNEFTQSQEPKHIIGIEELTESSHSAKAVETSALMSTTAKAWTTVQTNFLIPILTPSPMVLAPKAIITTLDTAVGVVSDANPDKDGDGFDASEDVVVKEEN